MKKRSCIAISCLLACLFMTASTLYANVMPVLDLPGKGCQYEWSKSIPVPNSNAVTVTFSAKAKNDIHVCISKEKDQTSPMYEVVIGGWNNTRSVIRRAAQSQELVAVTRNGNDFANVATPDRYDQYWVTMDGGLIKVGKGRTPGQRVIMQADDRKRFHNGLKYVAFSSQDTTINYRDIRVSGMSEPGNARPGKHDKRHGVKMSDGKPELVGEYLFDQVSLKDTSGLNNEARLLGSKNVPAKRRSAFCTSYSQGEYLEIPLNAKNTFATNSFSVSLWVKTTDNPKDPRGIVLNYLKYTKAQWSFSLTPGGKVGFVLRDEKNKTTGVNHPINDGKWHHVVGIRDRGKKEIRLYVDGSLKGTAQDVQGQVNSGQSIWVGNHLNRGFEGCIDDIRLYRNVISDQAIRDLFYK